MTTVSIALCTCNGERFLPEQLQSLLDQHRRPDELVVCDDGSTDRTLSILAAFAQLAPFPVRVTQNATRLGITANFAQAIALCSGDFIALADQDDVWLPRKLACLERVLKERPQNMAAFSDARLVTADLAPTGRTVWQSVGFTAHARQLFQAGRAGAVLIKQPVVTGATLMMRSALRSIALPIPTGWMHDEWLAMIAASTGSIVPVEDPLILYRQHSGNAIGGFRKNLATKIQNAQALPRHFYLDAEIERFRALLERLRAGSIPAAALSPIVAKLAHLERRRNWPAARSRRWMPILREWLSGGYKRYSRNWHSIAFDLAAPDETTPECQR